MIRVTEALLELLRSGERGALATVIRTGGSTPQRAGARLVMRGDGSLVGTVGGGAIEDVVIQALERCRVDRRPRVLTHDLGRDLGMCCGGRMEVFVEPIEGTPRLVIFGAGHVGMAVAAIASSVGFAITVVDDREELNDEARFPGATRVLSVPREARARIAPRASDWILVTTHDHRLDEEALDTYADLPHAYLGVIGSRRKIVRILQRIRARRAASSKEMPPLDRVHAPVGLDLGAISPEEIAVSIVAEMIAIRHGKPGPHLRAIDDPAIRRAIDAEPAPASDDDDRD